MLFLLVAGIGADQCSAAPRESVARLSVADAAQSLKARVNQRVESLGFLMASGVCSSESMRPHRMPVQCLERGTHHS